MNTKLYLASIAVTIFLIATACSPERSSLPILDQALPGETNYEVVPLVPVTGELFIEPSQQAYDFEQEARVYPNLKLHSACASEDIHRQGKCEEKEQNGVTFGSGNGNIEAPAQPAQKLHSACVSENIQRQENCVE